MKIGDTVRILYGVYANQIGKIIGSDGDWFNVRLRHGTYAYNKYDLEKQ